LRAPGDPSGYDALTMEIRNTTKQPLKVPLPGGKRLFLGLGGTGQISPKAADHPPVKKLIDEGVIEILGGGRDGGGMGTGKQGGINSSQSDGGSGNIRRTGDR